MSLAGNNSNSGTSGRSSIFETFHTPSFGDETFEVQPVKAFSHPPEPADAVSGSRSMENPTSTHHPNAEGLQQRQEATTTAEEEEEEYALDEEEDVSSSENAETTLWMSCSPGRDLTDDEADEEWGESTSQEMDEMNEEQELDDEGKSSDGDDDDEDDGLPLSKLARKQFIDREPIHPNARHPAISRKTKPAADKKAGSKKQIPANSKKKKKLKLVKRSSYSFFYSDTQNAIKSQNPAATFGEISKIVANMWDHLGTDLKEEYSRRAEEFNAQHKDEIMLAARSKPKKAKKSSSKSKHRILDSEAQSESLDSLEGPAFKGDSESKDDSSDNVDAGSASFGDSSRSKLRKEDRQDRETKMKPICNYTKCQNPAVDDPRWEYNYCSPQCVISHCKDVFKAWVANRKSAYCET